LSQFNALFAVSPTYSQVGQGKLYDNAESGNRRSHLKTAKESPFFRMTILKWHEILYF